MIRKNYFSFFILLFITASLCSLNASAQDQKPFVAHEVIEIGGGQKVEILRCRGEGPVEECDCIYYTDKRQNGKRQWQNANRIREEQKSAQMEVTAAKELASEQAKAASAAKTKDAAEKKAAKEKETTASSETNAVIETIKEQNKEIKAKGTVKANAYRGSAKARQAQSEAAKQPALSLKEIARQRDSINRSRTPKVDETLMADKETDTEPVDKTVMPAPSKPVEKIPAQPAATAASPTATMSQPAAKSNVKKPVEDTSDVVDFSTLRKMEEENGTAVYEPPVKSATDEKTFMTNNVKDTVANVPVPKSEEEPAPKPRRTEDKVNDNAVKDLTVDTMKTMTAPPKNEAEQPGILNSTDTTATSNTVEGLKETMKDEMAAVDTAVKLNDKPAETTKKKEKKVKKSKKKTEEKVTEAPASMEPIPPVEDVPLTPLQKAAQAADSSRKAKEQTDSTGTPAPEEKKDINGTKQEDVQSKDQGALKQENKTGTNTTAAIDKNVAASTASSGIYGSKKKLDRHITTA